jgi:hypothetical protein
MWCSGGGEKGVLIPNQFSYFICVVLVVIYLFYAI